MYAKRGNEIWVLVSTTGKPLFTQIEVYHSESAARLAFMKFKKLIVTDLIPREEIYENSPTEFLLSDGQQGRIYHTEVL